jgi:putative DNA primase/helicase
MREPSTSTSATSWQIIDEPPVRFARSTTTKALPVPKAGGSVELFRPFCNLVKPKARADNEFVVLVGHVLAVLRPNASYPVFAALGEHGTCKSTLSTLIRRLTDPRAPEQRSPPTSEDDLIVGAKHAHVLAFDNISALPDWLSDAFCRLATGGGAGKRRLYSDDDEVLFDGKRPIFLTGIEDFVTRPDLVDRSNMFNLEVVKEDKRLSEASLSGNSRRRLPRYSEPCSTALSLASRICRASRSRRSRAWRISCCGRKPARAPIGRLAPS